MRRRVWVPAATGAAAAVLAGAVVAVSGAEDAAPAAPAAAVDTAPVTRGPLASAVALAGTLTYRARPDGSPYVAVNQASGVYTWLPQAGDAVGCGDVLYRVDDEPVTVLCGTVPAFRDLREGDTGRDVRQLNRTLHVRGGARFTARTAAALRRRGLGADGRLPRSAVVVLPGRVRVAKVAAGVGTAARPGAPVVRATSGTLEVQVALEASQQGAVHRGDRARITLPGNRVVRGRVRRIGRVAQAPDGQGAEAGAATIPASIALDAPGRARGLDRAPVQVEIATRGVDDALSVPVLALVGRAGGGFAVEVVRPGGARSLVRVRLGLFDTSAARVAVAGALAEGDRVVVPAP